MSLAALTAIVAVIVAPLRPQPSPIAVVVAAAAASGPRLLESRLTGGFPYAPLAAPVRGDAPAPANWRILSAAALAQERADIDPSASNLQALGSAAALAGNHDAAVQAFEDAVAVEPGSATLLSDLAAAYLARAAGAGHAIDLPRAIDAAAGALRRNPRLLEARFNYALALEQLHLRHQAGRAWDAYLALAPADAWADEIRHRRAATPSPGPADQPPSAEADLALGRWAAAARVDPLAPVPDLSATGPFHAAVDDELRRTPPARRRALATLVSALLDADAALARGDLEHASRVVPPVDAAVPSVDSPIGLWVRRTRLSATFGSSAGRNLRREAEVLLAGAHRLGFAGLEGDALHRLGAFDFVAGRYEQALERYEAAARLRASIGDRRGTASSRMVSGEAYGRLGRTPEAWSAFVDVLRAGPFSDALLHQSRFTSAATLAVNDGLVGAGIALAREGLDQLRPDSPPAQRTSSLSITARALAVAGDREESARMLGAAHEMADAVPAGPLGDRVRAEVAFLDVEVQAVTEPTVALAAAAVAERGLVASNTRQRLLALRLFEARACRARGDSDGARRALQAGADLVEAQLKEIAQQDFLPSFVDASWDVFSERVDLEATAGQGAAALLWLNRGYDVRRRWTGVPRDGALDVASRGGPIVAYLSRPEALWIWVVRAGVVRQRRVPVRRAELEHAAARLTQLLAMDVPDTLDRHVATMAGLVWWPIAGWLGDVREPPSRVALVLDPVLQRVPWALLPWSRDDHATRIVDVAATVICPSVFACGDLTTVHLTAQPRVAALHAGQGGAGLPPLPAARDESERIARRYAGALVEVATEGRFAAAMAERTIVHFSGHAVPDDRYPGRSQLLLTDPTGQAVRVGLARVLRGPVATELVVLSACSTSRAEARRGEGGVGVAGEFLRAGVPFVVATQWDVRDDAAAEIMDLVHEALAAGIAPWAAVRDAQRVVRQRRVRPARDWAGYVAYAAAPRP